MLPDAIEKSIARQSPEVQAIILGLLEKIAELAAGLPRLMALMAYAFRQTAYWRDSEALWARALACDHRDCLAHRNLAGALAAQERLETAISHFRICMEADLNDGESRVQYRQSAHASPSPSKNSP